MSGVLTLHGALTLALTAGAIILFSRDRIPLQTSALGVLVVLIALFEFVPYEDGLEALEATEFFSGFGHEALVSICALMIMGRGLERTGALQSVASVLARLWPKYPAIALLATLVLGAVLSGFVNNTPIVIMLLPMLVAVCLQNSISSTGILLPMGLATIIGGMGTTIGTSTNLLVVTIAADMGLREFGMFDFSLPVAIAGFVGILFLWLVAPRLLPKREPPLTDTSPRVFTGVLRIEEDSAAAEKSLANALELTGGNMRVDEIQRGEDLYLMKLPTITLKAGDQLIVSDTPDNLKAFEQQLGAQLATEDSSATSENESEDRVPKLAEIAVTSGSSLDNRTLSGVGFETRFGLLPVALHRSGSPDQIADVANARLRPGDVLLVQGDAQHIEALKRTGEMLVLDGVVDLPVREKSRIAVVTMGLVVAAAAFGFAPISVAAVAGVLVMLVTRCLTWSDAADALSIPVILIVVTSLALGTALVGTGGTQFLAELFVNVTRELPIYAVLALLMIMMAAVTNVVSNNAAAIIGTPVAASIANGFGVAVEPFLLAVIFGANMSFATPIGYKTNLLVMSAGGYRFSDFMRVGIPLTILMWLAFSAILPMMYDL